MPDLLLELFSEEIPARMQAQAASDLRGLVEKALGERGLMAEGGRTLVTPRRLTLHLAGLPARQPDLREEKKGPRVGAPEAALAGFLKSAGLASIEEAKVETDAKKGSFYVAVVERKGRTTLEILAEILPAIIKSFPWPKSMRWGAQSASSDALRWVRPLHSIVCTFGPETEEPDVVAFEVGGIISGNITRGHRFMAPGDFRVKRFEDYVAKLDAAKVIADPERRKDIIRNDARDLALAHGLELVEDEALLNEVAGLVEWPVVLMGEFEESFLALPPEVIRATIRANQKCFVLKHPHAATPTPDPSPQGGGESVRLANKFILVANIIASDGGAAIAAGNARVVRARLSDANFFWESDLRVKLEDRLPKLDAIVFHEKLGTQGERVKRIVALARELAPLVGADADEAARAALLCKADLVSEMVGEFPELQGLMGRYYAGAQGESAAVAAALEDHYKPQGPSDRVPNAPVSIAVALADKLDTLVGFWAIDEKPTGSKDPYALRRAALGVVRIVLENGVRLPLKDIILWLADAITEQIGNRESKILLSSAPAEIVGPNGVELVLSGALGTPSPLMKSVLRRFHKDLLSFLAERLKVYLRDKGARHDLIDAVFALPDQDDLVLIVRRVEALGKFLDSDDGKNLLAGYKRAANILKAEEKKDGAGAFDAAHDGHLLSIAEEKTLANAIASAARGCAASVKSEDFEAAMRALATLRAPVDAFFEKVTVNDSDPRLRLNRLALLNELRRAMLTVADFSKVGG